MHLDGGAPKTISLSCQKFKHFPRFRDVHVKEDKMTFIAVRRINLTVAVILSVRYGYRSDRQTWTCTFYSINLSTMLSHLKRKLEVEKDRWNRSEDENMLQTSLLWILHAQSYLAKMDICTHLIEAIDRKTKKEARKKSTANERITLNPLYYFVSIIRAILGGCVVTTRHYFCLLLSSSRPFSIINFHMNCNRYNMQALRLICVRFTVLDGERVVLQVELWNIHWHLQRITANKVGFYCLAKAVDVSSDSIIVFSCYYSFDRWLFVCQIQPIKQLLFVWARVVCI